MLAAAFFGSTPFVILTFATGASNLQLSQGHDGRFVSITVNLARYHEIDQKLVLDIGSDLPEPQQRAKTGDTANIRRLIIDM